MKGDFKLFWTCSTLVDATPRLKNELLTSGNEQKNLLLAAINSSNDITRLVVDSM